MDCGRLVSSFDRVVSHLSAASAVATARACWTRRWRSHIATHPDPASKRCKPIHFTNRSLLSAALCVECASPPCAIAPRLPNFRCAFSHSGNQRRPARLSRSRATGLSARGRATRRLFADMPWKTLPLRNEVFLPAPGKPCSPAGYLLRGDAIQDLRTRT